MEIKTIGVIGAGVMGQGIAQLAAQSGFQTLIFDAAVDHARTACEKIYASWDKLERKGRFTNEKVEDSKSRLNAALELKDLKKCDLVIEAIVEDIDIKQSVFRKLEGICSEDAILCSNTSSLSITDLSIGLMRPENFAGLHFFNPAPIMKLVEIIPTKTTDDQVTRVLRECTDRMGKISVRAKDSPGFIVNRCARPYYSEALMMLEEDMASVEVIDKCLQSGGGFPLGPFQLIDLVGLDINLKATETVWNAFDQHDRFKPSFILRNKHDKGHLGRKTGRGFYDYPLASKDGTLLEFSGSDVSVVEIAKASGLDVVVVQSEAKTAQSLSEKEGRPVLVLDQLVGSFEQDKLAHLACASFGINGDDRNAIMSSFAAKGIRLHFVKDRPGLIVTRMAAALLNEARHADASKVATPEDIDISLKAGLNFAFGPFEMAKNIGLEILNSLQQALYLDTGSDRYQG